MENSVETVDYSGYKGPPARAASRRNNLSRIVHFFFFPKRAGWCIIRERLAIVWTDEDKECTEFMPYRYPYSNRSRRRRRPILAGVVLIALVAAISYGGATLWQHYDDQRLTRNMSQGSASPQSASSSEDVLAASGDEVSEAEGEAASQDSSSSQEESQAAAQELAYGQPVPESDWASTSYFDDAVFVGDSITDGIKLYGVMNNATVIAHTGINPETILYKEVIKTDEGTVSVLDALAQVDAGKIYIMQGANGVAFINQEKFIEYYGQLIDEVKAIHPDATIYVQSILPVTAAKSSDPLYSNDKIDSYNQALLELTEEKQVYYLNVAEAFKDENGNLPDEASPKDGMHFGVDYYTKWFDYLKTHTVEGITNENN